VIVPTETNEDNVVTAVLTSVPLVGKVTAVLSLIVIAVVNAPEKVNEPPNVMVDPAAFDTPVPPFAAGNIPVIPLVKLTVVGPVFTWPLASVTLKPKVST
jgi:hypothetical protein